MMITPTDLMWACIGCTGFGVLAGMTLMILAERVIMRGVE